MLKKAISLPDNPVQQAVRQTLGMLKQWTEAEELFLAQSDQVNSSLIHPHEVLLHKEGAGTLQESY